MTAASVVVVNFDGERFLDACLSTLLAQTLADYEVIVVDNGSTDGSQELIRRSFPAVRLIENGENLGFAAANNIGMREAKGEVIAFLNNDTEVHPEWLERLALAAGEPGAGGATSRIYSLTERDRLIFTTPLIDRFTGRALWVADDVGPSDVHYLAGAAMAVKREVIDRVGPMDEAYFAYFEETDWCARMLRAGYRLVYEPRAIVWHQEGGSTDADTWRSLMVRNRLRFVLKNFDPPYLATALAAYPFELLVTALGHGTPGDAPRMLAAVGWNARHLFQTLEARREAMRRLAPPGPYNSRLARAARR